MINRRCLYLVSYALLLSILLAPQLFGQLRKEAKIEMVQFIQKLQQSGLAVQKMYSKEMEDIGVSQLLVPENMIRPDTLKRSKIQCLKLFVAIRNYRNNFIKLFDEMEDRTHDMSLPSEEKLEFIEGVFSARGNVLKKVFQFITNQEEIALQILNIVNFFNARVGKVSLDSSGKYKFKIDRDEIEYGRLINRFVALSNEETALQLQFQAENKTDKLLDELRK